MIYAFAEFELDEELFELRYRGEPVPVQARVWKTICYLVQQRARVVDKAELLDAVWAGTAVSETAISQVIMLARKALRDETGQQRIIKTVRGRGFRFVAKVEHAKERAAQLEVAVSAPPVSRVAQAPATSVAPSATLVGRDAELCALDQRIEQAERGQGGLLLIEGEPGIGKSALVQELARRAQARGLLVLWGKAWEEGGAPPFWPWVQVLRALLERQGSAAQRALLEAFSELRAIVPELAEPQSARPAEIDGARARFRLFDAMTRLLRAVTGGAARSAELAIAPRPCLILLEDIHAVDEASVQLLRFMSQELDDLSLLVIGTFRDLELAGHRSLESLVSGLAPAQRMRLSGLSQAQAERLLELRLGQRPPARVCQAVHQLSAGNPLLIGELARKHDAGGSLDLSGLSDFALPERIAEAVRRQLAELPEATREVLEAASTLGRELSLPLLSGLLERDEPAVLEQVAPAMRRGLIQTTGGAHGRLSFSHATICSAIYSGLAPTRRIELHRRIAERLEAGPQDQLPLYEIAHHYYLAAAGGARKKAIELAKRAADQAMVMQAYEVAAVLLDRAHGLAELEGFDSASLHELLIASGHAWYQANDMERAVARIDRAAERAWAEGSSEHYIWAVLVGTSFMRGALLHDAARQEQLRKALSVMAPGDSVPNAMLLGGHLLSLRAPEALAERFETSRRAVEMARRLGNSDALRWALNVQHYGLWGAAHPSELLQVADELVALSSDAQSGELLLDALMWRLNDHTELGELALAMRDFERYVALAERSHSPYHRYMAVMAECFNMSARGELGDAAELSERARTLGLRVQEPLADAFHAVRQLFLALDSDAPAHEVIAADPPSSVPHEYRLFWALGWARCERTDDARRTLSSYALGGFDRLLIDGLRRPTLAALGELSVLLNDVNSAEPIYRLLAPYAGLHMLLQAAVYMGPVAYYLGRLAALLGRDHEAEQHLEAAMVQCTSSEAKIHLARSRQEHARLLARRQRTLSH